MNGHHLILGELTDCLTGEILTDTHDERLRQIIARHLLQQGGYRPEEIRPRQWLRVSAGEETALVPVDFVITLAGVIPMLIKYGPGSTVTRHQPTLAIARLLAPYAIPVVVVSNGQTADVLDGISGRLIGQGLDAIPDRTALLRLTEAWQGEPVSARQAELAARVVYAYEVNDSCPCDATICRLGKDAPDDH